MPKRPSSNPRIDQLAVGYLATQPGMNQVKIAKLLNISQSAVSRHYQAVKDRYIQRVFRREELSPAVWLKVQQRISPHKLEAKLRALAAEHGRSGPVVHVVPLPPQGPESVSAPSSVSHHTPEFETFAAGAAPVVRELLGRVKGRVGVAWGSTIWHTAQALRALPEWPRRSAGTIDFIPLCGDPLVNSLEVYADRTSSRIASELSRIINGDANRPAWLGLVPAFIPGKDFSEREIKVINRLIDLVPQYGRIFGPRSPGSRGEAPLAGDLDMILTAAGSSEHPVGFGRSPLLKLEAPQSRALAEHIYGDIGGVLVPKLVRDSKKKHGEPEVHLLVQDLTRRWTGLKMEHLVACASRAFTEEDSKGARPGVILLGFGTDLAQLVLEAVRRGLINHLIIGSPLEAELARGLRDRFESSAR